ncbi:MAG: DUF6027 family protein [Sporichthyaceae bacterium]
MDLRLERWDGTWEPGDRNANFKAEVRSYTHLDPSQTLRGLSEETGIPPGALAHYVLAKWASAGNEALLQVGPTMVERLWGIVADAEATGTDADRLAAYEALRPILSWLHAGLDERA